MIRRILEKKREVDGLRKGNGDESGGGSRWWESRERERLWLMVGRWGGEGRRRW